MVDVISSLSEETKHPDNKVKSNMAISLVILENIFYPHNGLNPKTVIFTIKKLCPKNQDKGMKNRDIDRKLIKNIVGTCSLTIIAYYIYKFKRLKSRS